LNFRKIVNRQTISKKQLESFDEFKRFLKIVKRFSGVEYFPNRLTISNDFAIVKRIQTI